MGTSWGEVREFLAWVILALLLVLALLAVYLYVTREKYSPVRQPRVPSPAPMGVFKTWAALSGVEECVNTTRRILKMGGTIADVTVATMLCACVRMMHRCGMGGGFFAVYYNRSSRSALTFNAREWAPQAATTNMYRANRSLSSSGFLAAAVPGELLGFRRMLDRIGSNVPWEELFRDAIQLARDGFHFDENAAYELKMREREVLASDVLRRQFCRGTSENTTTMTSKEVYTNPKLAEALSVIAREGHGAFYGGSVGERLIRDIQRNGGIMTLSDLERYQVLVQPALRRDFRNGLSLFTAGPPAGGIVMAFMLAVMESYRDPSQPIGNSLADDDTTFHRFLETVKFALAKRMDLGDPDHIDIDEAVHNFSSSSFLSLVRSKIKETPYNDIADYGLRYLDNEDYGTGLFAVLMPDGDAFAIMSTLNQPWGSLAFSESTGILLNNQMDDFATPGAISVFGLLPSPTNYIRPEKRPQSSMSPLVAIDADGNVSLVAVSSGGSRIATGLTQVLMRALWMNHTLKEAVDAPRVHHQLLPNEAKVESNIDYDIAYGLEARGHKIKYESWSGDMMAIQRRPGDDHIYAMRDYRRSNTTGGMDGD